MQRFNRQALRYYEVVIVVLCSVCGEPANADDEACPVCDAVDVRAVPEDRLPPTPEGRLIANAHRTVEKINDLNTARAQQLDEDAKARILRALRARAEGQVSVIESRLREEQTRLREEQELLDTALYNETLNRLKRELQELL